MRRKSPCYNFLWIPDCRKAWIDWHRCVWNLGSSIGGSLQDRLLQRLIQVCHDRFLGFRITMETEAERRISIKEVPKTDRLADSRVFIIR